MDHNSIVCVGKDGTNPASTYGKPIWNGEAKDIVLLVNCECGDGDSIQCFRYLTAVKSKVKKVIFRCNEDLIILFQGNIDGVTFIAKELEIPYFDEIIHVMAMPQHLSTDPYLHPNIGVNPSTSIQLFSLLTFFKVGFCWSGNPFNPTDRFRSIDKNLFKEFRIDGLKYISLNKLYDPPEDFVDIRNMMTDWNQTSYIVSCLDLIITVDTAIAHLSGSMGKETWLLISNKYDKRWDQNCYKSVKIFRKKTSWEDLINDVSPVFKQYLYSKQSTGVVSKSGSAEVT